MLRQGLKSIHRQVAKKEFAPIASVSKRFIETGIEDLPEEERPNKLEEYKKTLITNILTDPAAESNITKDVTLLQSLTNNKQQLASVLKLSAQVGATLAYQGWEAGDMVKNAPVRVAVTGAAGAIGYSLIPRILSGEFLGPRQPVILHLIEKNDPAAMKALQGVVMEVEDCAFPLCRGIIATSDLSVGFKDVDYVFLVGAKAKEQNMERRDLLKENAKIFVEQGGALNDHAKKSALTLVVGNPANTNALIASSNAPKLAASQFSALMRLDQQRAYAQVSLKTGVPVSKLNKIIVWGNHSTTQFPDVNQATATLADGKEAKLVDLIKDNEWIQKTFIPALQQRSDEASAASAADAALKHMRDWAMGTNGSWTSMAVPSDGSYGVAPGVYVSYPVVCTGAGKYEVVKGLNLDKFSQDKIAASVKELQEERKGVEALLGKSKK